MEKVIGWRGRDQVTITYNKGLGQIAYHLHSGEAHELLAYVDEKGENLFPLYSSEIDDKSNLGKHKERGKLTEEEIGETVIETIGGVLESNEFLKSDSPRISAAFEEILALDEQREIVPPTQEQIKNKSLRIENDKLKERIKALEGSLRDSQGENSDLKRKNSDLEEQNGALKNENSVLKEELKEKDGLIAKLQKMLSRTLDFSKKVRDSVFGKIFFGKPLRELNIDHALPEGKDIGEI